MDESRRTGSVARTAASRVNRRVVSFVSGRSQRFQRVAWPAYHLIPDLVDAMPGRRGQLVPSRRQLRTNFIGGPDFEEVGREFLRYFVDLGGLRPEHRVLEVGCGFGRMAAALTTYLSPRGSYDGLDVLPEAVRWCRQRISPRYANFRFELADVHNSLYNPTGRFQACDYVFPYATASFDFVILTSVFTHMFRGDMEHYSEEMARVLKPGGSGLITFFLVTDDARRSMDAGAGRFRFRDTGQGYWVADPDKPAAAVAYEEGDVRRVFGDVGLHVDQPVHYGTWSSGDDGLSFQDIVIVRRSPPAMELVGE